MRRAESELNEGEMKKSETKESCDVDSWLVDNGRCQPENGWTRVVAVAISKLAPARATVKSAKLDKQRTRRAMAGVRARDYDMKGAHGFDLEPRSCLLHSCLSLLQAFAQATCERARELANDKTLARVRASIQPKYGWLMRGARPSPADSASAHLQERGEAHGRRPPRTVEGPRAAVC